MAKKPKSIDEIITLLPEDAEHRASILEALNLIKNGATWNDLVLREIVRTTPNTVPLLDKATLAWLPRHLQLEVGKIQKVKAVQIQAPRAGKKAVYHQLVEGEVNDGKPIVDVYKIQCSCGNYFLGREPEHQLRCDLCKLASVIPPSEPHKVELTKQAQIMLRILTKRNLNKKARKTVESKLFTLMRDKGMSQEEIRELVAKSGYTPVV
jgi:hypothetical protein